MRYDSGQFGSFDGLDNRKAILDCFRRMGQGLPDDVAGMRRAGFLQGLLSLSDAFAGRPLLTTPCSAAQAYHLFVAITGCLGVPIELAARRLEEVVRCLTIGTKAVTPEPPP